MVGKNSSFLCLTDNISFLKDWSKYQIWPLGTFKKFIFDILNFAQEPLQKECSILMRTDIMSIKMKKKKNYRKVALHNYTLIQKL